MARSLLKCESHCRPVAATGSLLPGALWAAVATCGASRSRAEGSRESWHRPGALPVLVGSGFPGSIAARDSAPPWLPGSSASCYYLT